jgi:hypothetical protein
MLLLQYGDRAVIETLASLVQKTPDDLDALLEDILKVGGARTRKATHPARRVASLDALLAEYPEKASALRDLQARFVSRTLMPEMKDVRRFLDRHGQPSSSLKKRDDAFAMVARQLVKLPLAELQAMVSMEPDSNFSSLGVISDQILGRK